MSSAIFFGIFREKFVGHFETNFGCIFSTNKTTQKYKSIFMHKKIELLINCNIDKILRTHYYLSDRLYFFRIYLSISMVRT